MSSNYENVVKTTTYDLLNNNTTLLNTSLPQQMLHLSFLSIVPTICSGVTSHLTLYTSHNTMYHCKQLVISKTFLITEGLNEVKCEP